MLRSVVATVLPVFLIFAMGCGKKAAPPGAKATGTQPQTTVTAPADLSDKNVKTTIPLPIPFFESADVGRSVKQDGTIDFKTDTFTPADHLYISVKSREVPAGLAANLVIRSPEKKPVVDARFEFVPATGRAVFPVNDLTKWKPGLYDIEVTMDGDVVFKHGVTIAGKTSAKPKSKAR